MAGSGFSFSPLDLAIIALYAAVILGKGIWPARSRANTAEDYFLAGLGEPAQGVGRAVADQLRDPAGGGVADLRGGTLRVAGGGAGGVGRGRRGGHVVADRRSQVSHSATQTIGRRFPNPPFGSSDRFCSRPCLTTQTYSQVT